MASRWTTVIASLLFLLLGSDPSVLVLGQDPDEWDCGNECRLEVVETIPDGMPPSTYSTTFQSWSELLTLAQSSIDIASYYWTLRDYDTPNFPHPTSDQGSEILDGLLNASQNGVQIRIAKHINTNSFPNEDIPELTAVGAQVRDVDFESFLGSGILHTKMWIVDGKHVYLGSANLDWRALTQVKELGLHAVNCPCIGRDMAKTFDVYWELGTENGVVPAIPAEWPAQFESPFNVAAQANLTSTTGITYSTFVSSAPPELCPNGRTTDLDAIFHVMQEAEEYIHVAVMDYFPLIMFDGPLKYWGELDNAFKNAALRGVSVKLLMAKWTNTRPSARMFLESLRSMTKAYANVDIQVKMYVVPTDEDQATIPFARVNHNKYVVTDKATHIGTSNWSGDYFIATGGVGFVAKTTNATVGENRDLRSQVAFIFERDWNSEYSLTLEEAWPEAYPQPTTQATVEPSCPAGTATMTTAGSFAFFALIQILLISILF